MDRVECETLAGAIVQVDRADVVDLGKQAGRRPFAEVEHQPLAGGLQEEARRPFGADAGNQP